MDNESIGVDNSAGGNGIINGGNDDNDGHDDNGGNDGNGSGSLIKNSAFVVVATLIISIVQLF